MCVLLLFKRKRGMAGYCTAVLIKTCSLHNVSAPAPNTITHLLSHTHIDNLKSPNPPTQTELMYERHWTISDRYQRLEEKTENMLLNTGRKTGGEAATKTQKKAKTEAACSLMPGNIWIIVPRWFKITISRILYLSLQATSPVGPYTPNEKLKVSDDCSWYVPCDP